MTPELRSLTVRLERAERRARLSGLLAFAAVGLTLLLNVRPPARAQTPGVSLAGLVSSLSALTLRVASLELKAPVPGPPGPAGPGFTPDKIALLNTMTLSRDPNVGGTDTLLTITGVNVQIVDGTGSTNGTVTDPGPGSGAVHVPHLTGLGNLTIGYNALTSHGNNVRTGSHNLILGDYNGYSGFGGLVAGIGNTLSGSYTSVSGGGGNTASGNGTSVTGGSGNVAAGQFASVSGGQGNAASQDFATVSGGQAVHADAVNGWAAGGAYDPLYLGKSGPGAYHSP